MRLSNAVRSSHLGGTVYLKKIMEAGEWVLSGQDEAKAFRKWISNGSERFQNREWRGLRGQSHRRFQQGKLIVESELGKGSHFSLNAVLSLVLLGENG